MKWDRTGEENNSGTGGKREWKRTGEENNSGTRGKESRE